MAMNDGVTVSKQTVLGLRERGESGRSIAVPVEGRTADILHREIRKHVAPGSTLHTDEHAGYRGLAGEYEHEAVNHGKGKRGLYGTWHKASVQHLHRYVNECTFRLDEGNVKVHTMRRIEAFLRRAFKVRVAYKTLVEAEA